MATGTIILAAALLVRPLPAQAGMVQIVALGASNTAGKGVSPESAWPTRLEQSLRAQGYDVRVTNAGISGDDTRRMLARLDDAVPEGTRIVILEKAASNDSLRHVDTAGNIAAMSNRLRDRHIVVIVIPGMHRWADDQLQPDGIHITEAGHAAVAAKLVPLVIEALRNLQ